MADAPTVTASSPGRVTILGEHTDYNGGVALAVATPQRIWVAVTPDGSGTLVVESSALGASRIGIDAREGPAHLVVAASLARQAGLHGARLVVDGDLPLQ